MPYKHFDDHDLGLSETLAVDRTALANERTLLAYLRTSIMLAVSSVSLIKFFPDNKCAVTIGLLIVPISISVAALGFRRYLTLFRSLLRMRSRDSKSAQ